MKRLVYFIIIPFALVSLVSCYKDVGPVEPEGSMPEGEISFSQHVQPIFNSYCVSCHPSSGNLDLRDGYSYNNLVNKPASGYNGILVVPGDAESSILYKKIDGSGAYGSNMPLGNSLSSTQIAIIRDWINEGAQNN